MQPAFHNALHAIPYQGRVRILLPYRPDGCTPAGRNYHNKDRFQKMLPYRPDGCNSSRIAFRRCCPVVRTDAAVFLYVPEKEI
jgi:hypothetical protein